MKHGVYYFKPLLFRWDPAKSLFKRIGAIRYPFLCVITPVFDPSFDSLRQLIIELRRQSYGRFIHVMISNGPSPRIKALVSELNEHDLRFIYDEIEEQPVSNPVELLINLGIRREYSIKKYNADRYLFLDADAKIADDDYFLKLYRAHKQFKRDVLITLVQMYTHDPLNILPFFPIKRGHIDLANYSFSKRIAKSIAYPTDYDPEMYISNDYRFFARIANENNTALLNFVSAVRDGNNTYKRVSELFDEYKPQQ